MFTSMSVTVNDFNIFEQFLFSSSQLLNPNLYLYALIKGMIAKRIK